MKVKLSLLEIFGAIRKNKGSVYIIHIFNGGTKVIVYIRKQDIPIMRNEILNSNGVAHSDQISVRELRWHHKLLWSTDTVYDWG